MTAMTSSTDDGTQRILNLGSAHVIDQPEYTDKAGIAQLGEQQTEVLEVACSIHAPGIYARAKLKLFPRKYLCTHCKQMLPLHR